MTDRTDRTEMLGHLHVIHAFARTIVIFGNQPGVVFVDEGQRIEKATNALFRLLGLTPGEVAEPRPRDSFDDDQRTHPYCPMGCGCRLWTEDSDANDCACGGPCAWDTFDQFLRDVLDHPGEYRADVDRRAES